MVAAAKELRDLRSPPGNRLEALHGNRDGQHGIRINEQWRICFEWTDDGPANVETLTITDWRTACSRMECVRSTRAKSCEKNS